MAVVRSSAGCRCGCLPHACISYPHYSGTRRFDRIALILFFLFFLFIYFFFSILTFYFPASGQAVVTGVVPSPPPVRAFNFYRAYGSPFPLLVDFHRMLLTHAFALSASQFEHKKKSLRIYTSMHSGGLELTKIDL